MKAHPNAMRKISHQASPLLTLVTVGSVNPVMLGKGLGVVPDELGTSTSSDKHTPRAGITLVVPWQLAETQLPARRTWLELEQAKQFCGPGPEHEEQLESQA